MTKFLSKREKIILFATLAIIIFSILFNFLLEPLLNRNSILNQRITVARAKLSKYRRLIEYKDKLESQYKNFTSALTIPREEDTFVGALAEIERIAKDAHLRIIDIRPGTSKDTGTKKSMPIDLRMEGTIEGYLQFIYTIENYPTLLKIRAIRLNALANSQLVEGIFSISQIILSE